MAANPEVLNYLIAGAKRRGIDPATVVRAFGHEGLNVFDPNQPDRGGDEGSSFGPFQLHYKGISKSMPNAGMGDDFTEKTGLNARDPSTWKAQTDYVLDHLQNGGTWAPWMGAAAEGITGRMGLPDGYRPNATSPQMATDMASPGNPLMPRPSGQVQGPPPPPGWTPKPVPGREQIATEMMKNMTKGLGGTSMFGGGQPPSLLAGMDMPKASRIDTPEIPTFDPNQIAQQRQNLAMAMQRLNSGRLF